jgi:hypothetical protein
VHPESRHVSVAQLIVGQKRCALRTMSRVKKASVVVIAVAAVALFFVGVERAWFAAEPTSGGKTVTEWLDRLALYEYRTTARGVARVPRSPEHVARDPAVEALVSIGPKATPILVARLQERAQWDRSEGRLHPVKMWGQWLWNRFRRADMGRPPAPDRWSDFQRKRKNAAAYGLLVLGTNANAGFGRFLEAFAEASKHESVSGTQVPGPPAGIYPGDVTEMARKTHPQRRDELVSEIHNGLHHTNAWGRILAVQCISAFPEELARWKDDLLGLTTDQDDQVQEAALLQLLTLAQQDDLLAILPASEIGRAATAVAENPARSERLRGLAQTVSDLANEKADQQE